MNKILSFFVDCLIFVNQIAILIFLCLGVDCISNKYDFPWQIIAIFITIIFSIKQNKKIKKRKQENEKLKNKLWNCLNDSCFDYISVEEKYKIVNTVSEKEFNGIFR